MEKIFSFDQEEREYRAEIIEIIRGVGTDEEIKLALEEYHDNDIAAALEELSAEEREKLLAILGVEGMSEVVPFLEDAGEYLSELDASQAADIIAEMEAEGMPQISTRPLLVPAERVLKRLEQLTRAD